jgi:hypothetical protein
MLVRDDAVIRTPGARTGIDLDQHLHRRQLIAWFSARDITA